MRSRSHHPFLDVTGVKAAFLTVTDGHVAPADATMAMAAGARALGAEIYRRTRVTDISRLDTGEWLVATDQGELRCEHVVNAGGSYCNEVASWTGHRAPIANMLHHYLITEPVPQLIAHQPELPVVRDPWAHCVFPRGGQRHTGRAVRDLAARTSAGTGAAAPGISRASWSRRSWTACMPQLERAGRALSAVRAVGHQACHLGRDPAHAGWRRRCPVPRPGRAITGCIAARRWASARAPALGRFLAQWMVHGQPEINVREFDPRRFGDWVTPGIHARRRRRRLPAHVLLLQAGRAARR